MSRYSFGIRVVCALLLWCLAAAPVRAQRSDGPFAGLFDGDQGGGATVLDVRGSLSGSQYDDGLPADQSRASADRFLTSGKASSFDGRVNYRPRTRWGDFKLNGGGALQYYPASHFASATYDIDSGMTVNLTRRLVLGAQGGASYSPFFGFAPFLNANGADPSRLTDAFSFADLAQPNRTLNGSLTLTGNYWKHSSLEGDVSWSDTRFLGSANGAFRTVGAHGLFRHQVTRPLGFHLGYGVDAEQHPRDEGPAFENQIIDVGLDYGNTLSFARRFSFNFSAGTSIIRQGAQAVDPAALTQAKGAITEFRVNGTALLTGGFYRTWSASLGYARGTGFIPGFRVPLLEDSADAWIRGLIARRLQWTSGAGVSRGQVGFSSSKLFLTYTATSKLELGLTRSLGGFAEYSYYHYKVPAGSTIFDILPQLARQAWTVGLTVWVPIIRDVRRVR